jgi:hypothetical protein
MKLFDDLGARMATIKNPNVHCWAIGVMVYSLVEDAGNGP